MWLTTNNFAVRLPPKVPESASPDELQNRSHGWASMSLMASGASKKQACLRSVGAGEATSSHGASVATGEKYISEEHQSAASCKLQAASGKCSTAE